MASDTATTAADSTCFMLCSLSGEYRSRPEGASRTAGGQKPLLHSGLPCSAAAARAPRYTQRVEPTKPSASLADTMRQLGALSTVGLSFVLAIVLGAAAGYYLDKWLGTGPWLFLLFMVFGLVAGILNVYRTANRFLK